jgi:3-dehydroquinate synthase
MTELVRNCVEIKTSFVSSDERETKGLRALLNFGHTLGHGIETAAGYGTLFHGEAVALGMLAAAHISRARAGLPAEAVAEIGETIRHFGLPMQLPNRISKDQILAAMFADKKFVDGRIRFVVSSALGSARVADDISLDDLKSALQTLESSVP